jgi:hypothetical protein
MKIYNVTDVETPKLLQHKLVNQTLSIGGAPVAPGGSVNLKGSIEDHAQIHHALLVGAVVVDDLPNGYTKAKAAKKVVVADKVPVADAVVVTDAPTTGKRTKSGF